jgi:hypothetical protein
MVNRKGTKIFTGSGKFISGTLLNKVRILMNFANVHDNVSDADTNPSLFLLKPDPPRFFVTENCKKVLLITVQSMKTSLLC